MAIASKLLTTLPLVRLFSDESHAYAAALRHQRTSVERSAADGLHSGETLWGGMHAGQFVCMAWPWAEVMDDIVVISDLTSIESNLLPIGDGGDGIDASGYCYRELSSIVCRMQWQDAVLDTLARARKASAN